MIGIELGTIDETGAALIAAGLLSVLVFPLAGLTLLRRGEPVARPDDPEAGGVAAGAAALERSPT